MNTVWWCGLWAQIALNSGGAESCAGGKLWHRHGSEPLSSSAYSSFVTFNSKGEQISEESGRRATFFLATTHHRTLRCGWKSLSETAMTACRQRKEKKKKKILIKFRPVVFRAYFSSSHMLYSKHARCRRIVNVTSLADWLSRGFFLALQTKEAYVEEGYRWLTWSRLLITPSNLKIILKARSAPMCDIVSDLNELREKKKNEPKQKLSVEASSQHVEV